MSNWIDNATVGNTLQGEAAKIAAGLGHRMTSWVMHPQRKATYMARCVDCNEAATIAVRQFRSAPIAGSAVFFRCRKAA